MRRLHVVFDTSAILDYEERVAVGEILSEVEANGGAVGLPLWCLVEAATHPAMAPDALERLTELKVAAVVGFDPDRWRALASAATLLGSLPAAAAFLLSDDHDCPILTADPGRYAPLGDDPPVLPI